MNIRKPTDYSEMYVAMDRAMAQELSQMDLYCELGRIVSLRLEKGAAVAAAEYLSERYPQTKGFSPRNLRRMRDFFRAYGDNPELLKAAKELNWTQNVVILEAELTEQERLWYLWEAAHHSWTKAELVEHIERKSCEEKSVVGNNDMCYTDCVTDGLQIGRGPMKMGMITIRMERFALWRWIQDQVRTRKEIYPQFGATAINWGFNIREGPKAQFG